MKKYRVAIIGHTGCGDYGHGVDTAFTKMPNVEIAAVADPDEAGRTAAQKRTGAVAAYADYRQMLKHEMPDLVAICPRWVDQHHAMLLAAAEVGAHVYMEKPFCRDLLESDEVVQALQMRHLKLGIAHVSEYSPVLTTVLKLLDDGIIGDILELRGRGKEDRRGGGEDLWVLGSHVFALMRSVGRGDPTSCSATVFQSGQPLESAHIREGNEGIGLLAGDRLHAVYQFPGNVIGQFASVRSRGGNPTRFGLQVYGSKGIIELQSGYLRPAFLLQDPSWSPGRSGRTWQTITSDGIDKPESRTDGSYEGGHIAAISDLIHAIETESETKCSVEDCRGVVQMTAAIYESQRVGGPVALPLKTRRNPLTLYRQTDVSRQ